MQKQTLKSIALVIVGATILSFGTYNFNYQNSITEGGVLGLLLLLKNLFDISPSITSVVVDFSLFLLGARFFGKRFVLYSLLCTTTFSITYKVFEAIGFMIPDLSSNMLLASVLAGVFVGVGVGLVVKAGGASCGDDVIALVVSKFTPLKVNWVFMITDLTVLVLSLSYLPLRQIVWSLVAVTISGKLISMIYYHAQPDELTEQEAVLSE
ncbi:MAG: YitT family protein [Cellulosilyticaceae bacterium]